MEEKKQIFIQIRIDLSYFVLKNYFFKSPIKYAPY